jgi:hypothetical protein
VKTHRKLKVVVLVVVVWALVAGMFCLLGYSKAKAGRDALNQIKGHANAQALQDGSVQHQLDAAASDMKSAHFRLANPLVQPWRLVPIVGRQISSAIDLTNSGKDVAQVGSNALKQANALSQMSKTNRQATLTQLASIASTANGQLNRLNLGPNGRLISPLTHARKQMLTDVITVQQNLQRAAAGANGMASLFNDNGSYLIFAANNGEMRSGSGMLLSAGVLNTGNGRVTVGDMKDVGNYTVPNDSVTWPDQINKLWGFLQEKGKFQDLMLSPRFDVSAPLAEQMWKTSTGQQVDGVMVVDPEMLQSILKATGPVTADGQTFTADNIQHYLLYQQYVGLTASTNLSRRDGLSDVAQAAFAAIDKGSWDPITLARSLASAANGRHVLLYSNNAKVNQYWNVAGVAGTLDENSMMLSLVNLGGNKLDQFMKVDASVKEDVIASGYDVTVTAKVTNTAPTSGPPYVLGPFNNSGLATGEYDGLLNFNLPQDATGIVFDGQQNEFLSGPDGPTQAIAVQADVKAGQSATYVLHFYRARTAQFTRVMPSARVPATVWHYGSDTWSDTQAHFIIP